LHAIDATLIKEFLIGILLVFVVLTMKFRMFSDSFFIVKKNAEIGLFEFYVSAIARGANFCA